jgi:SAM-dependent methyltransferase
MSAKSMYEDGAYFERNPTWHQEDSPWKAEQVRKILAKHSIIPSTICEIGCGAGEVLSCLAKEYGDRVMASGYEISPQAFDICREKERANVHFLLADAFAEGQPTFDVVMAIDVFEHVEDYFGFLRKCRAKGVYKVFHIPLELSVQTVLRGSPILKSRASVGHIHYFTKETALASLNDTGYEVVDYVYTSGALGLPNRGWKADLLRLPRRIFFGFHQDLAVRVLGGFSLLVLAR